MKEAPTNSGKTYSVHTANGCTVSDDSGWSKTIDAPDGYFTAHGSTVYLSDDEATMREVFKLAPQQKLALLGVLGGNDGLPAGYTRLEYLESTGLQVIDTDIYPGDKDDGFDIKFVLLDKKTAYQPLLSFACATPNISERRNFGREDKNNYFFISSLRWAVFDKELVAGETYIASGSRQYMRDIDTLAVYGEPINLYTRDAYYGYANCGLTYALFGQKTRYPNGVRFSSLGQWRVFYCKMYIEGELVRDFIPCLDPAGAPCMFDRVSLQPFYNQGTGDFLYPGKEQEVSTFSLRRPITYAQLTEHGVCRLYRVPRGYNGTKEEYAMEHGFKPLVETPQPEEGYWSPRWRETEEEIVLEWVETEPPAEQNDETLT